MKVKFLVEEEVIILRRGVIELDLDESDLSNEEEVKEMACGIFTAALDNEDSFGDEVRQTEKYDCDIIARRIDQRDNSIYLERLPIKEALKWNIKFG